MGRLGLPAAESSYVVGVLASLLVLIGLARLVTRVADRAAARAVLILLPWMPVAFIFRVRANHEYPMLVCLVWALVALDGAQRSWPWLLGLAAALAGALVVKGVFALFVVGACGLWILIDPAGGRDEEHAWRPWVALAAGLVGMVATFMLYDAWYTRATGHPFWAAYWQRQVGPMTFASPLAQAAVIGKHVSFYLKHVAWHAAPWTLVLAWVAFRRATNRSAVALSRHDVRALAFVCAFVLASFIALSVPSRVAERYTFSAAFLLGATGIVATMRHWPRVAGWIGRVDAAIPALPALVWTILVVGRIVLGS
jgi:4-amino-4-deoxy-L-arabinose transferase-like glycosyltransferase